MTFLAYVAGLGNATQTGDDWARPVAWARVNREIEEPRAADEGYRNAEVLRLDIEHHRGAKPLRPALDLEFVVGDRLDLLGH